MFYMNPWDETMEIDPGLNHFSGSVYKLSSKFKLLIIDGFK